MTLHLLTFRFRRDRTRGAAGPPAPPGRRHPLMSQPHDPHDEALKRLDARLDAVKAAREARTRKAQFDTGAIGAGYKLVAELIGGVLGGLGLGWVFDQWVGTSPWGLLLGVLVGTGLAVFLIARSAGRMSAQAAAKAGPVSSVPFDDEDDEDNGWPAGPGQNERD
ncbi:MAG TPA: AtpZ/AtpI family protein [Phenylobacterium sp.]|nr:AtpZ/AtpI family protein [Phenylobacterium sp.]